MLQIQIVGKLVLYSLRNVAVEPTTPSGASGRFVSKAIKSRRGDDDGWVMFFLLRMTFWLCVVCVLVPGHSDKSSMQPPIDTASAISAAGAAMVDMRGFCERQPDACVVGGKVAVALGQKAEAGARTLFDIVSTQLKGDSKDQKPAGDARVIQTSAPGTLTPADLAPNWHAPVPLPPRREARAGRPAV